MDEEPTKVKLRNDVTRQHSAIAFKSFCGLSVKSTRNK